MDRRSLPSLFSFYFGILLLFNPTYLLAGWPGISGDTPGDLRRAIGWQTTPPSPERVEMKIEVPIAKVLFESLRNKPIGGPIMLEGYPMPDGSKTKVSLQPFALWTEDALIVEYDRKGEVHRESPVERTQLLGLVEGKSGNIVQLRMVENALLGFVVFDGKLYSHAIYEQNGELIAVFVRKGDALKLGGKLQELLQGMEAAQPEQPRVLSEFCCVGGPGGEPIKYLELAIETDDELFQELGSLDAIRYQVENLVAGIDAIYFRNAGVVMRLTHLGIHTGQQPDPYGATTSGGAIREFRDLWNMDPLRQAVPRDVALLLSGRVLGGNQIAPPWECRGGNRAGQWCDPNSSQSWASCGGGGSCEWVGVPLCEQQKSYAIIEGSPTQEWDNPDRLRNTILDTAHEMGHLFGAEHADCYNPPIDECGISGAQSMRGNACFGQEIPPQNNQATLMSTCAARFSVDWLPDFHQRVLSDHIQPTANSAACLTEAHIVELENGVAVTNLATTPTTTYTYFAIDVPERVNNLTVETQGGSGDVRLYLNYGSIPKYFTASSTAPGPNQSIQLQSPLRAGRWYILLWGPSGFSGVSLTASYERCRDLRIGYVDSVGPAQAGQEIRFCFEVPTGVRDLYFRSRQIIPLADVDLTAQYQGMPYTAATTGTADEYIAIPNTQPRLGEWEATLHAVTAFSSVGMTAGYAQLLQNNQPVSASGDGIVNRGFIIELPGSVTSLTVSSSGGSGDISLWGKEGAWPRVPQPPFPPPIDLLTKTSQTTNTNNETLTWSLQPLSSTGIRQFFVVLTVDQTVNPKNYENVTLTASWQ